MKKKITALFLCVSLLAIAVVGASLAYFTDTETKTNTFTMGNVDIDLTEPAWKDTDAHNLMPGTTFAKDPTITVKEGSEDCYVYLDLSLNKYKSLCWVMAADASADKTIGFTIFDDDGNLLDAYKNESGVFSTTNFLTALAYDKDLRAAVIGKWFGGINHTDWTVLSIPDQNDILTVRLAYNGGALSAGDAVTFMTSFGMPASVTSEMIDSGKTIGGMQHTFNEEGSVLNMTFTAYAVQAENFTTSIQAWEATFGATA